ncbi:MAG: hypothetical protein II437_05150, partial [Oscillospiraceae bacterium]|nr:hypothetical protein [Oscillospiraceae bacterium]
NYDYLSTFGTRYDYTAHILNPNLEDGAENWVITTSDPSRNPINSGQPLTASDGSQFNRYLDFWKGDGGFTFDANQTIDLPAGRYMLTVAGRASAAQLYETTLKLNDKEFEGLVYAGPFTEPSAADPTNYFQLYATVSNNGVTTHQSIVPQMRLPEESKTPPKRTADHEKKNVECS